MVDVKRYLFGKTSQIISWARVSKYLVFKTLKLVSSGRYCFKIHTVTRNLHFCWVIEKKISEVHRHYPVPHKIGLSPTSLYGT